MKNLVQDAKQEIESLIGKALDSLQLSSQYPINTETPKDKNHGNFSCNIAMLTAKELRKAPRIIADELCAVIAGLMDTPQFKNSDIAKVEAAGSGFINFYMKREWLYKTFEAIEQLGSDYGKTDIGNGKRVLVEFVSANPTGPMHMGNARGGALGDGIAALLEWTGHDVTREFYVNDSGNQIERFAASLEARYKQITTGQGEFPEDGYQGQDITEHAGTFAQNHSDSYSKQALTEYALKANLTAMKDCLERYGIKYDIWFHESSLYDGEIEQTVEYLKNKGYTYESDGALWFKTTMFGCEKDDVLIRANGLPTYFTPDIAYHKNKLDKRGFDRIIDIWGADHHGHVARMKAAVTALGLNADNFEIIILQLVRLMQNQEVVRMSKRTGKSITMSDLLDEIGVDAARFFFNMKQPDTHMDFDLDLAVSQSNDNPVYYVQYAHARTCSIISLLAGEGILVQPASDIDFTVLTAPEETELIAKLLSVPNEIQMAALFLEPSKITRCVIDIAALFHSFYGACRVKTDRIPLMNARLKLVDSTRIAIKNLLTLLGVSAPEKM